VHVSAPPPSLEPKIATDVQPSGWLQIRERRSTSVDSRCRLHATGAKPARPKSACRAQLAARQLLDTTFTSDAPRCAAQKRARASPAGANEGTVVHLRVSAASTAASQWLVCCARARAFSAYSGFDRGASQERASTMKCLSCLCTPQNAGKLRLPA
jgi:hypothetical protein